MMCSTANGVSGCGGGGCSDSGTSDGSGIIGGNVRANRAHSMYVYTKFYLYLLRIHTHTRIHAGTFTFIGALYR